MATSSEIKDLQADPEGASQTQTILILQYDPTLCSFCKDMSNGVTDPGEPFWTRPLTELIETAETCHYCALWVQSLEASAEAIGVEGEEMATQLHPLLQSKFEPKDVVLQYIEMHGLFEGSVSQKLIWPHLGNIWGSMDLVPAKDHWRLNLGPLSPSDQSETVWKGIRFWLDQCRRRHPDCDQKRDLSWRPSRLLHIQSEDESLKIRLVEGDEIPLGVEYLTLSHCWGDSTPLRLTTETVEHFKSRIPFDELPKTFRETCEATKRLGHEYLWIDSLCIIQDDLEDWAVESASMSHVYGNSYLNLAAAAAQNANDGLFDQCHERDIKSWLPIRIKRDWGKMFSGDYFVCDYRNWWNKLNNAPLNRRAWVLQERTLAPRVIYFGLEQVAFECPETLACERLPYGDVVRSDGIISGLGNRLKEFIASARRGEKADVLEDFLPRWNDVVRSYSQGKLSVETDKMVALGAVADTFALALEPSGQDEVKTEQKTEQGAEDDGESASAVPEAAKKPSSSQDLFVGGLWRPNMEMQLAWRATSQVMGQQISGEAPWAYGQRPSQYVAPSWSWCSLKDVLIEPQQASSIDINFAKVVDVNIKHVPGFKDSDIRNGLKYCCAPGSSMKLQCHVLPIVGFGNYGTVGIPDFDGTRDEPLQLQTKNYWDVDFEKEATQAEMPCLVPIYVDMGRVKRAIHGIIVDSRAHEQGGDARYFVRLGAWSLDEDVKGFWDAVETFNRAKPGAEDGSDLYDGVFWRMEGEREYEKKDGVLQRVIEIR